MREGCTKFVQCWEAGMAIRQNEGDMVESPNQNLTICQRSLETSNPRPQVHKVFHFLLLWQQNSLFGNGPFKANVSEM
jgi:hypothetical protein